MTDERMLRIDIPKGCKKKGIAWRFDDILELGENGILLEELEPAPPKDWFPACWHENKHGNCGGDFWFEEKGTVVIDDDLSANMVMPHHKEECKECIYRIPKVKQ
jgi:hypothetical protein